MNGRKIMYRNVITVYVLMVVTFGFYGLIWTVKSKRDMNALGASIPTSWLLLVPFVSLYYYYKYCEGYSTYIKRDNNTILWFLVAMIAGIVLPAIVQADLNKIALQLESGSNRNSARSNSAGRFFRRPYLLMQLPLYKLHNKVKTGCVAVYFHIKSAGLIVETVLLIGRLIRKVQLGGKYSSVWLSDFHVDMLSSPWV